MRPEALHRQFIDWKKTGKNLQMLREDDGCLRRRVCFALNHDKGNCDGDCAACRFEIDNHISRSELAAVFGVSESVIFNWENGRTVVDYEDLLFYVQLSGVALDEIIVFMDR